MNSRTTSKTATKVSALAIARRLLALLVPAAIVLGGIMAFLYLRETNSMRKVLRLKETNHLHTQQKVISSYFQAIATDVLALSKHYELRMMLDSNETRYRKSLAKEFLWFSRIKRIYDQIRFLDERGMEALRVNFNDGTPSTVPTQELQTKGERYYFKDAFQLAMGEIFVSQFDLNIEHGKVELPLKPMIRFGTPVFDSRGKKRGIVVLNYLGSDLLHTLEMLSVNGLGQVLLLNAEGYFLSGPNPDDEWGFMYESKKDRTFAGAFPEAWHEISRAESGQFLNADGMYTFTTIRPLTETQISSSGSREPFTPSDVLLESKDYYWKLVSHVSPGLLYGWSGALLAGILKIYAVMIVLLAIGSGSVAYASVRRKLAEEEVKKHRDHLEELVEQRTVELTRTSEQVQESEEKYRDLYDNAPDMFFSVDSKTANIIECNQTLTNALGYTKEEIIGRLIFDVYTPDSAEHAKANVFPVFVKTGTIIGEELQLQRKDGSKIDVSLNVTAVRDEEGNILYSRSVLRDITMQKKLELQLQQSQKMEAIGTLAGGIAHDFNNILTAIMGYTEIAGIAIPKENEVHQTLGQVLKAGHRAKDLVQQILGFARQSKEEKKPIKVGLIAKEVLKLVRASLPSTIEIRHEITARSDTIMADPIQIHQVLMNLCTNAHYAMGQKGGVLEVSLSDVDLDSTNASQYPDLEPGSYVKLTVSDTGSGMDQGTLERIFDPYFTTKEKEVGTGMGLAVAHGIIKNHRGAITVQSEPGKGSTFQALLPLVEMEFEPQVEALDAYPLGNERILFVDDEEPIMDLGKRMLGHLGYDVVALTSSMEALAVFREKPKQFDLVITDQTMPGLTGKMLTEEVMRIRPDIPVILCTGFSEQISPEKAKALGIRGFLFKPLIISDLANAIRRVLDQNR